MQGTMYILTRIAPCVLTDPTIDLYQSFIHCTLYICVCQLPFFVWSFFSTFSVFHVQDFVLS